MHAKQKVAKCMVVGDLKLGNVRAEHTDMMVECFQGIICFGGYTKEEFPNCRLVLSGVLRRRDVSWRFIGARNDRFVG